MATLEARVQELEKENTSLKKRLAELTPAPAAEPRPTEKQKEKKTTTESIPKEDTENQIERYHCPFCRGQDITYCMCEMIHYGCATCGGIYHYCPEDWFRPTLCQKKPNGGWMQAQCSKCLKTC